MLTPRIPDVDGCETFEQSFDFSKFPNLQEVNFGFRIGWKGGGLPWIPMALSTLRAATSPRLSAIRLEFAGSSVVNQPIETLMEDMGNDFLRTADEVSRIDREFEGAVNFTVAPDWKVGVVLDTLNVRFRLQC